MKNERPRRERQRVSPTAGSAGASPSHNRNAEVVRLLAEWFHANKRAMPWRETRDAYRIWLSEIMLQQTQVATVIPYYERFLKRFPTVKALAAAPLDEVLKLWSGLGYYSRARNLHRGAQVVVEKFGGAVPQTLEEIREIPGIGAYTAGAVLSIAYSRPEPLVDGNVARVLARLLLIEGDVRKGAPNKKVWQTAAELMQSIGKVDPGDLNQALMELGATLCTPKSPDCARCPLARHCAARTKGVQQDFPQLEQKEASPVWHLRGWAVRDDAGKLLFAQRAPRGLFGGLWELPTERVEDRPAPTGSMTHVLTHRVLQISIESAALAEAPDRWRDPEAFPCWSGSYTRYRRLSAEDALAGKEIGLSSVQKKLLKRMLAERETLFA